MELTLQGFQAIRWRGNRFELKQRGDDGFVMVVHDLALPNSSRAKVEFSFAPAGEEWAALWDARKRKLGTYGLKAPNGVENLKKIVAGRQLWNYDKLEPTEKKIAL